jgi:hypothetical protein
MVGRLVWCRGVGGVGMDDIYDESLVDDGGGRGG